MAVRTLEDQVTSLLQKRVAEAKVAGSNSPDIEARAILESIALNLLLKPKAVLFIAHLARNALLNVVVQEIAAIDAMSKTVDDLGNTTFTVGSTLHLDKATNALLQLETLEKVDVEGQAFKRFDKAIDDFLNKSLAKTVRKLGSTELSRPDTEAATDLPVDFSTLVDLHTEMLARLYSLSVGVENFTSSPLGTILGLSTAYRARVDIEDITDIVNAGESGAQARDIAIRLLGDRAALKSVGNLPVIDSLLLDTLNQVPTGYVLQAQSDPATASTTSAVGPFVFSGGASASLTVNGNTLTAALFPQTTADLNNRAFILSNSGISFPVGITAGYGLFLHLVRPSAFAGYVLQDDGRYLKQVRVVFTGTSISLAQSLADINTALGAEGAAYEYITSGTGRIIIIAASGVTSITVSAYHTQASSSSLGALNVFTNSADASFGFFVGQSGNSGNTPVAFVVDALNQLFGSLITATATPDQAILVETLADSVGTSMIVASDASIGLNGTFKAQSNSIRLFGTVYGVATDPVDPNPLLDISDTFSTPSGDSVISNMTLERIILQDALDTFSGNVSAKSSLVESYSAFHDAVETFIGSWLQSDFSQDLTTLNRAVAVLSGKATPATRNTVQDILSDLKTELQSLSAALSTGTLPNDAGTDEKSVVTGIISTLTERRYDKALSLLLELRIQELFEITGETASFGGNLLKSMADLANSDVVFPNTRLDEDNGGFKGLVKEPEA